MGKIFYLMGKSASGKDSIYAYLMKQNDIKLSPVVLYTTRPVRHGEADGREYHFITEEKAQEIMESGKVIEERSYNTAAGIWRYMTVDDGSFDFGLNNYLAIGTLESYNKIREYFGEEYLEPVFIYVENGVRLERALQRERAQSEPNYSEICRRYLADEADFSEENLRNAGLLAEDGSIKGQFDNVDLVHCCENIRLYLCKSM